MQSSLEHNLHRESLQLKNTISLLDKWSWGISHKEANSILLKLSQEKYFPYQDIIINSECLWKGVGTDCPSRYGAIYNALTKKYKRSITVLDIGANNGYFSLKLAEDFKAQCTMVDTTERLTQICQLNTILAGRLLYLKKEFTVKDLKNLNKKTHFDVAIGLNVLHHIPDWKDFLDEMNSIADTTIIETPPTNDPRAEKKPSIPIIVEELNKRAGVIIAKTPRTLPGSFETLQKMEYGVGYDIPTYDKIESSMTIFDNAPAKPNFSPIDPSLLPEFNLSYS
jgi:SAM-dependent methyltransferase